MAEKLNKWFDATPYGSGTIDESAPSQWRYNTPHLHVTLYQRKTEWFVSCQKINLDWVAIDVAPDDTLEQIQDKAKQIVSGKIWQLYSSIEYGTN